MPKEQDLQRKATPSSRKPNRRKHDPMLINGVSALLAGGGLWVLSLVMDHQANFHVAARALLAPAWMALAVGAALLLLHVVIKRRTRFEAAMLLRQHSTFHEPMPPVLATPKRDVRRPARPKKRPSPVSAD
ncbi:hypothetical protein [Hydrogenophaga sp.]|uniref:hypothetical protein n=1 Tax=Hydrogenophaga sp. TaxID=1904254 RepID=UPI0027354AAF|nr:hypothetical protein [Hydrogenophaga sp.]MDP3349617.1 hypothetical protein [Hydrogenophaga sp.]MDZ4398149.1 hypothetical protein [Hydrogenophaga sp.]